MFVWPAAKTESAAGFYFVPYALKLYCKINIGPQNIDLGIVQNL